MVTGRFRHVRAHAEAPVTLGRCRWWDTRLGLGFCKMQGTPRYAVVLPQDCPPGWDHLPRGTRLSGRVIPGWRGRPRVIDVWVLS